MSRKHTPQSLAETLERRSIKIPECGCQIWLGAIDPKKGYGWVAGRRVHRVAWELAYGPIPDHMHVLHRCDVTCCINPYHLFLGTNADNVADKIAKGRYRYEWGEQRSLARLTDDDVRDILGNGSTMTHIAKSYGVSRRLIYNIKNGKAWKHITSPLDFRAIPKPMK